MLIEVRIPSPGESITEVEIGNWFVSNGDIVERDQEIGEIESDKATLPLLAESAGMVELKAEAGDMAKVGDVVALIDDTKAGTKINNKNSDDKTQAQKTNTDNNKTQQNQQPPSNEGQKTSGRKNIISDTNKNVKVTPVAQNIMDDNNLNIDDIINGIKRISKKEVEQVLKHPEENPDTNLTLNTTDRTEHVERMSSLRRKLSKRLVAVKNETAMLTTFNEVDMTQIITLRKKYQKNFIEAHEVKLGFMSFFAKASAIALQLFPKVNSMIDGENIVSPNYCDIGIAVQTPKGLMVPVIRNVEKMGLAQIEKQLIDKASLARKGRLPLEDMNGGTFTITNGGVFGSMLSTPIINPPQSGILGMHNIVERPVAIEGKVEIRPIMYVALSYDHRIIDGKDSVSFLYKIKELIENPYKMLFNGKNTDNLLLDI